MWWWRHRIPWKHKGLRFCRSQCVIHTFIQKCFIISSNECNNIGQYRPWQNVYECWPKSWDFFLSIDKNWSKFFGCYLVRCFTSVHPGDVPFLSTLDRVHREALHDVEGWNPHNISHQPSGNQRLASAQFWLSFRGCTSRLSSNSTVQHFPYGSNFLLQKPVLRSVLLLQNGLLQFKTRDERP